jgi:SAM-dependent methyltransferase
MSRAVDNRKLAAFRDKVVRDVGSAMSAALVLLGDQLGLWQALAQADGPLAPAELAARTETHERYIREWLDTMAASGYVTYHDGGYHLEPEQALALADSDSAAYLPGIFQITAAMWAAAPKIAANFRSGAGLDWDRHHPDLFEGTERFLRSEYLGRLVQSWLPALDGVVGKLEHGARVADVGCGEGASTLIMAHAFPASTFVGFDSRPRSVALARRRAEDTGVADRVTFEVAHAAEFAGGGYDLIAQFDSFHGLEDPAAAARHARDAIAPDGTWLLVEPFAADRPELNHHAIGRMFYACSTFVSVPNALARGGAALGAQVGASQLRQHVVSGGWSRFRKATTTAFHQVLEARP